MTERRQTPVSLTGGTKPKLQAIRAGAGHPPRLYSLPKSRHYAARLPAAAGVARARRRRWGHLVNSVGEPKTLLAFDGALRGVSVAALRGQARSVRRAPRPEGAPDGAAESLLPLIDQVLRDVQGAYDNLGTILVVVGPGSFTGIRVAVSAARSLALVADCPAIGVSSLTALALTALAAEPDPPALAAVALPAGRGSLYAGATLASGDDLLPPRLLAAHELAGFCDEVAALASGRSWLAVGAGFAESLPPDARRSPVEAIDALALVSAAPVLIKAARPASPLYLRAADAVPNVPKPLSKPPRPATSR